MSADALMGDVIFFQPAKRQIPNLVLVLGLHVEKIQQPH